MEKHLELCKILEKKREVLLQFECVTNEMFYENDVEKLEAYIAQRQALLEQIMAMDREIHRCCEGLSLWLQAMNHMCDRNNLPEDLAAIYDASLSVKAVASRIRNNDGAVVEHLEMTQAKLKEKIEEVNGGGYAVASKYYRAAQTGRSHVAMDERNKKI